MIASLRISAGRSYSKVIFIFPRFDEQKKSDRILSAFVLKLSKHEISYFLFNSKIKSITISRTKEQCKKLLQETIMQNERTEHKIFSLFFHLFVTLKSYIVTDYLILSRIAKMSLLSK